MKDHTEAALRSGHMTTRWDRYFCQFCGRDIREDFETNTLAIQFGDVDPLVDWESLESHINCNGSYCWDCLLEFEAQIRRAAR
jgi:hypothetical protein